MAKALKIRRKPEKPAAPSPPAFRKYTRLAVAIDMLQKQRITLLEPTTWEDKNDSWFMQEYKDIIGATTLLATCFAQTEDTHHHWHVFSAGMDGVCIEFDKAKILSAFNGIDGVRKGQVVYRKIDTLRRRDRIEPEELPFLKRRPYKPECEYRVIYVENSDEPIESKSFGISVDWINRITLSPWMPASLRLSVSKTLKAIEECQDLEIVRSTLFSNRDWRALTRKARPNSTRVRKPPTKIK